MTCKIIYLLGLMSFLNCTPQEKITKKNSSEVNTQTENTNSENKIYYFLEGENKFLEEFQMNVTFKNIQEDSRCPKEAQCVWQGVAVANLEVMSTTSRPVNLQISTLEMSNRNYYKTQVFNGYDISLKELTPYPSITDKGRKLQGKYKLGIVISKTKNEENTTK